jgi:peptidoglycan hydrolase-like protein with peptidoglycan-binding domain
VAFRNDDGSLSSFSARPVGTAPTATPTTTAPISDPLFPLQPGANGPAVAAIQGRLGITVDCAFGGQTRRAIEQWQATAGVPVTGAIDLASWQVLAVPTTWGDDANGNGAIEPSEVNLVCDGAVELPEAPPTPTTAAGPTTTVLAADPLFPVAPGANGAVVAAIQGRLGIGVDCAFGGQTRRAIEQWQATAGLPVTGTIDLASWERLAVPSTWGDDANGNGTIEPSEVNLVCDGAVELPAAPPPPVDTSDWPETQLSAVAATCSIPDEFQYAGDGGPDVRYDPEQDMITVIGAGAADSPERGNPVFDTMVCVLAYLRAPDRVVNQISQARAQDRMQFAVWEGMVAQWSYDTDAGLTLTIYSTEATAPESTTTSTTSTTTTTTTEAP